MKQMKQIARAGLLATILLLITIATTFAADSGEIDVSDGLDGDPFRARSLAAATDGQGNAVVAWAQSDGRFPDVRLVGGRSFSMYLR